MTDLVYNHHSLPFENQEQAREKIPDLLRVWLRARSFGYQAIRISQELDPSWYRIELARGYTWGDWVRRAAQADGVRRELVQAFKSMATKTPLLAHDEEEDALCEVRCDQGEAPLEALRAAYWLNTPAISHPTRSPWIADPLNCRLWELRGELAIEEPVRLVNLTDLASFERNRSFLEQQRQQLHSTVSDLFENRSILYPRVVLCGEVEAALHDWTYGDAGLAFFQRVLEALNAVCESWKQEAKLFPGFLNALTAHGVRCSDESDSTKARFATNRRFRLPTGEAAFFWFHAKGSILRVHFLPNEVDKTVYVGYCGRHLPTVSDPT